MRRRPEGRALFGLVWQHGRITGAQRRAARNSGLFLVGCIAAGVSDCVVGEGVALTATVAVIGLVFAFASQAGVWIHLDEFGDRLIHGDAESDDDTEDC